MDNYAILGPIFVYDSVMEKGSPVLSVKEIWENATHWVCPRCERVISLGTDSALAIEQHFLGHGERLPRVDYWLGYVAALNKAARKDAK